MDILLAIIPAITWGSIVLVSVKLGGDEYSQTLGITIGALLFSIGIYWFSNPNLSWTVLIVGAISGFFWVIGQLNQLATVRYLGVSKTVPISTGMQLVATTLFGVLIFREWTTTIKIVLGSVALVLIIVGVLLTSIEEKEKQNSNTEEADSRKKLRKGILTLLISTAGYLVYVVIIRWFEVDGFAAILPQGVGMVVGAILLTARHRPWNRYALRNILAGFIWATGNLFLFLSQPKVGVAISFSLSQMGIVISTFGGIFFLGEKKSRRQMVFITIGSLLIIAGGVCLGFAKS
ncbi:GRP family sugar transporter [Risungbinella massiliensis]|uniref:GRP family sugar transporter n=1 Tax=Risungbinella massiliensis TaxID=1329796 RepID=UPI0005CBB1CA|nr:GRP family sugar transporter [Risungbinella massiliensis]